MPSQHIWFIWILIGKGKLKCRNLPPSAASLLPAITSRPYDQDDAVYAAASSALLIGLNNHALSIWPPGARQA